jgi:tetratricopeptide (TPR) repeat protein
MLLNSVEHAFSLIEAQNFSDALPILQDLHDQNPGNARVNYGLGITHLFFGQAEQAVPFLTAAAKVAKKEAAVFTTLASALNTDGRSTEALPHARKGAALDNKSEYANRILGEVYSDLRRPVMARQSFEQALKVEARSSRAHLGIFELETTLGNTEAAEERLHAAFALTPNDPMVLISTASSSDADLKGKALLNIERILSTLPANAVLPEITKLAFAAGKICDGDGDREKAFHYFNSFRRGLYRNYDAQKQAWFVNACKSVFTKEFFEKRQDFALSSERPVFVMGMPRSGTTLVEQIIARHPQAVGAGELQFVPDKIRELSHGRPRTPAFFEQALGLDKRQAQRIGRKYLTVLDGLDKRAKRVVDKMPHNFEHMWLLALLFPNARFIHVTRSAADTCLSIYMTPLPAYHSYNVDQTSLGHYYGQYTELMKHWSDVLPVDVYQQSYEALVGDREAESRALLNHVGLEWNDDCLKPPSKDTQVFTFSREQVRQKVYSSAIGRWKNYEPQIKPLLDTLNEAVK